MLLFVAILFCDVRFHVFVLYTMRPCLFIFFQSDCSQLCNRGNQFKKKKPTNFSVMSFCLIILTWLGLINILLYSFWTYWLRDVVSHFMWTQKNKVCTWSECSWPKLQHCCSRLWFRKIFLQLISNVSEVVKDKLFLRSDETRVAFS